MTPEQIEQLRDYLLYQDRSLEDGLFYIGIEVKEDIVNYAVMAGIGYCPACRLWVQKEEAVKDDGGYICFICSENGAIIT